MKKCQSICDIDDWCMCEAVQSLETKIEEDIKDLSLKDKKNYFSFLNEIINNYILPSFQNVRKIHYPVYGKHTLGDALKCKDCGSPIVYKFTKNNNYSRLTNNQICSCNDKKN